MRDWLAVTIIAAICAGSLFAVKPDDIEGL